MDETRTPTVLHRALANEQRKQLVDELRASGGGLDVQELGRRLELHPNTIRWHLGILADARLVASRSEGRTTPGRPRIVYTLTDGAGDAAETESYRLLATILSGAVAALESGRALAEAGGAAWGRYLVTQPPPNVRLSEAAAVTEVVELLAQQGFRPEAQGREIHMRRCPFRELAESDDGLVCQVHRGLISGALEALGSDLAVERLDPFVEPDLCVARLGRSRRERTP